MNELKVILSKLYSSMFKVIQAHCVLSFIVYKQKMSAPCGAEGFCEGNERRKSSPMVDIILHFNVTKCFNLR